MHANRRRCVHIRPTVIYVNGAGRINCKSLKEKLENARIRFQQSHFARKHNSSEPLQKLEPLQSYWESFGGPVTEGVQGNPARMQLRENVNGTRNRPCQHLVISLDPGVDQLRFTRMN